jgi:hypothetical protein
MDSLGIIQQYQRKERERLAKPVLRKLPVEETARNTLSYSIEGKKFRLLAGKKPVEGTFLNQFEKH